MPHIGIAVLSRTFGIEAIGLGDAARLMVAADQMHTIWVSQFQTDKERYSFDAEHATVDVVAEEQVVCIGTPAADLENLDQIEELPMNVADDGDGRADMDDVALAHQQFLSLGTYRLDDGLGQQLFLVES